MEYTALAAIEIMAAVQVIPCLVSDHDMQGMVNRAPLVGSVPPQVFCGASDAAEMARITGSYIARVGAEQARIVGCGPYGWVRLTADAQPTDLLFALEGCVPTAMSLGEVLRTSLSTLPDQALSFFN